MSVYESRKWTSHLFDVEGSMVREIMGRVILCAGWAAVIVLLYELGPEYFHRMAIAESAHSLIGPALALLLVFRTNSSYDRFWEGRKQWGAIVNESRNLARQAEAWLQRDRELARRLTRWAIAFSYGTMNHLRSEQSIGPAGQSLPDDEVEAVHRSGHVPLAVARRLTALIYEARGKGLIDPLQLQSMDQNVQQLVDYCGACERIRNTPAPFGYVVHLRRALIIYCLTLPLALIQRFGWETIPVTLIISYVMFGIEEIGVEIENPFELTINDLQLEALCNTIDFNLNGILNTKA